MNTANFKVYAFLVVVISLFTTISAESELDEGLSKYKYGYVISHNEGSTQAHLESRNGNLALGRYYVNLPSGSGQKVTYFADDLGFHSGVTYASRTGKGFSETSIAMGDKALAALGNSDLASSGTITANSFGLQFGEKITKAIAQDVTSKSASALPKLNYTPVPGGFYLTHEPIVVNNSTEHQSYVSGLTSEAFKASKDFNEKYSGGVSQSQTNTQTFYPTSENVKNEIKQLHIQSTTPSIKSYTSLPQQGLSIFGGKDKALQFSYQSPNIKVSSFNREPENLSYVEQKSIEKTNFADIDAKIISEVQKHAEQIILKDLQNKNLQNDLSKFTPLVQHLSTVTVQPIVVTSGGDGHLNNFVSSTPLPDLKNFRKSSQTASINSIQVTEKNHADQILEDSGSFRVSLSPSLTSSISVSPTPPQLIDAKSSDRSLDTNNSTLCLTDLCEKSSQIFSNSLNAEEPKLETVSPQSVVGTGLDAAKINPSYYPQNKLSQESHYITTIDVQKGISLDVQQNEDGSIQLASNFPFNKLSPHENQYAHPTPQPLTSNPVTVAPVLFQQTANPNLLNIPQKPYVINAVNLAPGFLSVPIAQNLGVLQGYNDLSPNKHQYNPDVHDRIENNGHDSENQLVPPPQPIIHQNNLQGSQISNDLRQGDLQQVEKNIQELREKIISDIDAQHEKEQEKQNSVDEERKQYFENLKKVEELKDQNSGSHNLAVDPRYQVNYQAGVSPATSVVTTNTLEPVPQVPFFQNVQPVLNSNDFKTYGNAVPVVYSKVQETNPEIYPKQAVPYNTHGLQTYAGNLYQGQQIINPVYVDNSIQQTTPSFATDRIQLNNYVQPIDLQVRYSIDKIGESEDTLKQVQQLGPVQGHLNAVPYKIDGLNVAPQTLVQANRDGKATLVNSVVPLDYRRVFQLKEPISLLQTIPVPQAQGPSFYSVPQQVAVPVQIPKPVNPAPLPTYQNPQPTQTKQYFGILNQRHTNKLRVQPLKPSVPDENAQRETYQNILSQISLQPTYYYYPGYPVNSRLQVRHTQKNLNSNSDQVASQSLIRRGKSLKNLRIEYGFKPPLRPSVEFSEEVKPSIYGPSVPPQ